MIRSMTGFGSATGGVGNSQVTVELRTVNHRFFNPSLKLPASFARWEAEVREALRRGIARGHVTVSVRTESSAVNGSVVNETRFGEYVTRLRELQLRYGLGESLELDTVLRLPDVIAYAEREDAGGSVDELVAIVNDALAALSAMREAEGQRLAQLLGERLELIERAVTRVADRAPERLVHERDRLQRAVRELANGIDVDSARLAQEIAVLADRLDVSEEIDRFRSHMTAFRDTLGTPGKDSVGKRLSFFLQELLREANTTGSKARDAEITLQVVLVKEELERMAEQVENIE